TERGFDLRLAAPAVLARASAAMAAAATAAATIAARSGGPPLSAGPTVTPGRRPGILRPGLRPGTALHRERDALALDIDLQHRHLDHLPRPHRLARILDEAVGQLGDVHQAVLVDADVDEGAEVRHVRHHALQAHAGAQVRDAFDTFGEARADELATGIAPGLLEFGEDVAHRRLAEAIVGERGRIQPAQRFAPADHLDDRPADSGQYALDHRIGLRVHRRRI